MTKRKEGPELRAARDRQAELELRWMRGYARLRRAWSRLEKLRVQLNRAIRRVVRLADEEAGGNSPRPGSEPTVNGE